MCYTYTVIIIVLLFNEFAAGIESMSRIYKSGKKRDIQLPYNIAIYIWIHS